MNDAESNYEQSDAPSVADVGASLECLESVLSRVTIRARRMLLTTPGVVATVPMIRGVWGAALHHLDREVWRVVFEGIGDGSQRTPRYVLRPAPPDPETAPAIEWVSFDAALPHDPVLLAAWDAAAESGLGPSRRRFFIKSTHGLRPDGSAAVEDGEPLDWTLDLAVSEGDARRPCEMVFDAPLRLVREGRLITKPTLTDIVLAGLRRLRPLLPDSAQPELRRLRQPLLDVAREVRARPWQGRRVDMVRWSGRQQAEIELRGVTGAIELPDGAGPLWPLVGALQWLHIGKGTVFGLGHLSIH